MFCPNCGTQNPDTAQTCSKCSFHLKGAAAPKFKGTMLMMNQPPLSPAGTAPRTPPPPAPLPPAPARPPWQGGLPMPGQVPNKLKGTMVGVAPMAGGLPPPPTPPPPPFGGSPPPPPFAPPPYAAPGGEGAASFSPPVPQAGVNPLGGTVAADAGVFAAYAAQHAPGAAGGFPSPGMPPPPFGAPPLGGTIAMQAPPNAHSLGNPPAPFGGGGPPPPGAGLTPFGAPPVPGGASPFAAPGNSHGGVDGAPLMAPPVMGGTQVMASSAAMMQAGASGIAPYSAASGGIAGTLKSEASVVLGPKKRNPITTLLLPIAVVVGGLVLGSLLGLLLAPLAGVGLVVAAGGLVWLLLISIQMLNELRTVTRAASLVWWPLLVPVYNMYFMATIVLGEVTKAKQMLHVQPPPQPALLYALLGPYALASDLNDLVR